jgi:hypothetical protein
VKTTDAQGCQGQEEGQKEEEDRKDLRFLMERFMGWSGYLPRCGKRIYSCTKRGESNE